MNDPFFTKTVCDRCGKPLTHGRTMSMYNEDCICLECANAERKREDYGKAVESDHAAIKQGNYNFKGIGL